MIVTIDISEHAVKELHDQLSIEAFMMGIDDYKELIKLDIIKFIAFKIAQAVQTKKYFTVIN